MGRRLTGRVWAARWWCRGHAWGHPRSLSIAGDERRICGTSGRPIGVLAVLAFGIRSLPFLIFYEQKGGCRCPPAGPMDVFLPDPSLLDSHGINSDFLSSLCRPPRKRAKEKERNRQPTRALRLAPGLDTKPVVHVGSLAKRVLHGPFRPPRDTSSSSSVSYPTLPAASFPNSSATATLGSNFNQVERRLSGGILQSAMRERQARDDVATSEGARTPRPSSAAVSVSSPSSAASDSSGSEPESYDSWLQNMRTIEALREYVKERLERREYVDEPASPRPDPVMLKTERREAETKPLYPALRMS
ncbi:pH-response transcription factor pacC/RIM101 [Magnaporthiopsis poae ATCC 64411]|uniref:pH-response transcription factor pacC/RIM101 n=1 Tax=Magnaporthiopsis poae (strain ATCC 64411 / 73-15) TaxID=644358 RepID=A0A0C4E710_MAGP6|nr:pH-response transcription factor pacC/RIM101 [Magnaporthiopsis poae ATCC 64411]